MQRLLVFAAAAALTVIPALAQQKKRIAILDFEYGTVSTYVSQIFGTNVDVGKGISDLLVEKLVNGGKFSVIERKVLDKVLKEQNFQNSDRADSSTAAKLGKILGVDAILVGSITQFGRDDKQTNVGGFGRVTGGIGIGGIGRRESKAVVAISTRMVNIETAEILLAATGKGESARGGTSLLGAGGNSTAAGGGGYDMRSSNFHATILGEATNKAVTDVAGQLEARADNLPTAPAPKVDGLVADVSGKTIILNVGSKSGVKVGDRLEVRRVSRTVKDPATGRVLRSISEKLGDLTITEVDAESAVGTFSGAGAPKVGDTVGSPQ
jgi:curli biogenesis system outer membrane secretion channel CsgG